jgi:rubrerythrin
MSSFDPVTLKYLTLAVKLEQNTNKFYETAREKVKDPNMKSFLNALMDHETGHLASATKVRDLYAAKQTAQVKAAAAMLKVHRPKNPFSGMKQIDRLTRPGADILDLLEEAAALEQKANEFYLEAAEHAQGDFIKSYLKKLAQEEIYHKEFIEAQKEAIHDNGYWSGIDHVTLEP